MDPTLNLDEFRTNAYTAGSNVGSMQTSAPSLLSQLKQNLVGIFAKDNPMMTAREQSLQDYMSTATKSRADVLPSNMPSVEGRPLALSPTQQDAITSSRNAAAMAPLAGWNEILKGMYGNIGDMVSGAGDIYKSSLAGEQQNATNLLNLYKAAIDEQNARTAATSSGTSGLDIAALLAEITGAQQESQAKNQADIDAILKAIYSTGEAAPAKKPSPTPSVQQTLKNTGGGGITIPGGMPFVTPGMKNLYTVQG